MNKETQFRVGETVVVGKDAKGRDKLGLIEQITITEELVIGKGSEKDYRLVGYQIRVSSSQVNEYKERGLGRSDIQLQPDSFQVKTGQKIKLDDGLEYVVEEARLRYEGQELISQYGSQMSANEQASVSSLGLHMGGFEWNISCVSEPLEDNDLVVNGWYVKARQTKDGQYDPTNKCVEFYQDSDRWIEIVGTIEGLECAPTEKLSPDFINYLKGTSLKRFIED